MSGFHGSRRKASGAPKKLSIRPLRSTFPPPVLFSSPSLPFVSQLALTWSYDIYFGALDAGQPTLPQNFDEKSWEQLSSALKAIFHREGIHFSLEELYQVSNGFIISCLSACTIIIIHVEMLMGWCEYV
jgi:hypothetical protein